MSDTVYIPEISQHVPNLSRPCRSTRGFRRTRGSLMSKLRVHQHCTGVPHFFLSFHPDDDALPLRLPRLVQHLSRKVPGLPPVGFRDLEGIKCYCGMQWCSFKPQLLLGSSGGLMGISGEFPWTAVRNHLAPFLSPQHAGRLALLDHLWRLLHGNIIRHGNIGQNGDAVCNPGAVLLHPSESSEST